jgi:ProP effector
MTTARQPPLTRAQAARAEAVIMVLARLWPFCFSVFEQRRKPLKIGIRNDLIVQLQPMIAKRGISEQDIANALFRYTSNPCYRWTCSKPSIARVDLDGCPNGVVEQTHADHAQRLLAARRRRNLKVRSDFGADKTTATSSADMAEGKHLTVRVAVV